MFFYCIYFSFLLFFWECFNSAKWRVSLGALDRRNFLLLLNICIKVSFKVWHVRKVEQSFSNHFLSIFGASPNAAMLQSNLYIRDTSMLKHQLIGCNFGYEFWLFLNINQTKTYNFSRLKSSCAFTSRWYIVADEVQRSRWRPWARKHLLCWGVSKSTKYSQSI